MYQNVQNHTKGSNLGAKKEKLTFRPCFTQKMLKFGPKTGLKNFGQNRLAMLISKLYPWP